MEDLRASDFDFPTSSSFRAWAAAVYDGEGPPEVDDLPPIECGERVFEPHRFPEEIAPETLDELREQLAALRSRVHVTAGRDALSLARRHAGAGTLLRERRVIQRPTSIEAKVVNDGDTRSA